MTTQKIAPEAGTSAKVTRNGLTGADIPEPTPAEIRNGRHSAAADSATSAGSAKYLCTLPVTGIERERAIEQLGLEKAAVISTNTVNWAGEARP